MKRGKVCPRCGKNVDGAHTCKPSPWLVEELKRTRREVAEEIQEQLIIDIPVYAYGDSEGGSALALQLNNAAIYCNQIITANSEKGE